MANDAGFGESLAYQLALTAARPPIQEAGPAKYWTTQGRSGAGDAMSQNANDELRSRLLKTFGEMARERPEFASLFKPFAGKYPFLSSEKQLALQEILDGASAARPGGWDRSDCGPEGCGDVRGRIRELLTPEEYFEYELRDAPLSHRLARTGVDFTEQEFREVYRLLASGQAEQERQIASVLGMEKFAQYQRAQDPIYRAMAQGRRRHGVAQEAIDSAYQLIKDTQRRIASANPGVRAAMRRELNNQLQARIGAELTELVLRYVDGDHAAASERGTPLERALFRAPAAGRIPRGLD